KIDTIGSEWSNDISFNFTNNKSEQIFATYYYSPFVANTSGDGSSDTRRNNLNIQTDLKLKMKNKFTFETGAKSTILNFKSVADYYKGAGINRVKDPVRTNTFHYDESINSF